MGCPSSIPPPLQLLSQPPRVHPTAPPIGRAGSGCPRLPVVGRAPGAGARGGGDVRLAERPRSAAAAGDRGAIITVSCFPALEPQIRGAILLLSTNFSGGRWRQRCRESRLQRRQRRSGNRLEPAGARISALLLRQARRAPPRPGPRARRAGPGRRASGRRAGLRTVPAGRPAARAAQTSASAAPRLISGPARTRPAAARLAAQPPVAIAMPPPTCC